MGVSERRLREKEQRRFSIIDAAEKVFFAHGVDKATMDEVAETAELSKGLLYFYFRNKDDLTHAIVLRGLRVLKQFFDRALQENEKGIDQVVAMGEAYVRFSREYPDYFNIMTWFEGQPNDCPCPGTYGEACAEAGEVCISLVAKAVANGIADGTVRSDIDPLQTAMALWAQTHGLISVIDYKAVKERHKISPEDLIKTAFLLSRSGLEPR